GNVEAAVSDVQASWRQHALHAPVARAEDAHSNHRPARAGLHLERQVVLGDRAPWPRRHRIRRAGHDAQAGCGWRLRAASLEDDAPANGGGFDDEQLHVVDVAAGDGDVERRVLVGLTGTRDAQHVLAWRDAANGELAVRLHL